jgi:hypothetical protein
MDGLDRVVVLAPEYVQNKHGYSLHAVTVVARNLDGKEKRS